MMERLNAVENRLPNNRDSRCFSRDCSRNYRTPERADNNPQNTHTIYVKEIKPEDIGFFYSDMEGNDPVKQIGRNMYYKNVNIFLDRVKDAAKFRG